MRNILLILAIVILSACGQKRMTGMRVNVLPFTGKVTPGQATVENGRIRYDYALHFAGREFNRNMTLRITPRLLYNGVIRRDTSFYLQGQGVVLTEYPVVSFKKGLDTIFHLDFNYEPGLENSVLAVEMEASICGKSRWVVGEVLNRNGVKIEQQRQVEQVRHPDVSGEIRGTLMFRKNEAAFKSDYSDLPFLKKELDDVLSASGSVLTQMEIIVSCSPDGNVQTSKELAYERYVKARDFLTDYFGLDRLPFFQRPDFLKYRVITQNWQGLYDLLEDSDLTGKYEIIARLKQVAGTARECRIDEMMVQYPIVENEFLPLLRRVDFAIYYTKPYEKEKVLVLPPVGE